MSSITSSMGTAPPATPTATLPAKIRFLVLSDTHNTAFPDSDKLCPVDVVLHCGDLTMIGGLSNYRAAIQDLAELDTELVLVIPGNHDVSLDSSWWRDNLDEDDDPEEDKKAHALFSGASSRGIHLLPEGVSTFALRDGRSFSIYASPYTPEFNGYAFAYRANEDRFSPAGPEPDDSAIIPDGVDIVMTHGPPGLPLNEYRLDTSATGVHCGCPKLWKAIQRARPRLHCFGHIHEGYGVQNVRWNGSNFDLDDEVARDGNGAVVLDRGTEGTVLLNAALMTHGQDHNNDPWIVDMPQR